MFKKAQIEKFLKWSFIILTIGSCLILLFGFLFSAGMHGFVLDFSYIKYFFSTFSPLLLVIVYSFFAYYGLRKNKNWGFIFGFSTVVPLLCFYFREVIRYFHIYIYSWDTAYNLFLMLLIILLTAMLLGLIKIKNILHYRFSDYIFSIVLSITLFCLLIYSPHF